MSAVMGTGGALFTATFTIPEGCDYIRIKFNGPTVSATISEWNDYEPEVDEVVELKARTGEVLPAYSIWMGAGTVHAYWTLAT